MSRIILVLAAVTTLAWVSGQPFPYELVIKFHQYSDPDHALSSGDCCDNSTYTDDYNTTLFLSIGSGETDQSNFSSSISSGSIGGGSVTFTDAVGDLENPVVLRANILPHSGYQLHIEYFQDIGSGALTQIDETFVSIPASALGNYSHPQNYVGEDKPVTINLSYCLRCSPNYTLCNVDNVTQCVNAYESSIGSGSGLASKTTQETVVQVTLLASSPDSYSSVRCPAVESTNSFMTGSTPVFTSTVTSSTSEPVFPSRTSKPFFPSSTSKPGFPCTPTSSNLESNIPTSSSPVANNSGGASVAVIAGAGLGVLVLVIAVVVLVVVVAVVLLQQRNKKSVPITSVSSNMDIHGANGDDKRLNIYDSVELNLNAERATDSTANAIHSTNEPPGIAPPVYADVQRCPPEELNSIQMEMANPMYDNSTMQQNEQPEYQETQRVVKNVLYSTTVQQNDQPEYQETQRQVNNALYSSTMQRNDQPEYQETQREVKNDLYSSTVQQNELPEYQETQREVKNILYA